MARQWFVGRTKQGRETYAQQNLRNQSFHTYLPMYISEQAAYPRIKPFLPTYIFIFLDPDNDRWRAVFNTFGMASQPMLMSGERPKPVRNEIVDGLIAREQFGLIKLKPKEQCKFKKGDRVVIRGNRSPLEFLFETVDDGGRAILFGQLLNRSFSFKVPLSKLASAGVSAVA